MLRQETAVESQELRDIDHRVSREACRSGWHQDVSGRIGKCEVAGKGSHNYRLNPAGIERVCLYHEHWPPVSRLGAASLRKIRPPDLPALNLCHLPNVLLQRLRLGALQSGIQFCWVPRINFVQALRDSLVLFVLQELRNRPGIQLTSRNLKTARCCFRHTKEVVR